jgi:hypothetical protein
MLSEGVPSTGSDTERWVSLSNPRIIQLQTPNYNSEIINPKSELKNNSKLLILNS